MKRYNILNLCQKKKEREREREKIKKKEKYIRKYTNAEIFVLF